jgi:hypothetical protein
MFFSNLAAGNVCLAPQEPRNGVLGRNSFRSVYADLTGKESETYEIA